MNFSKLATNFTILLAALSPNCAFSIAHQTDLTAAKRLCIWGGIDSKIDRAKVLELCSNKISLTQAEAWVSSKRLKEQHNTPVPLQKLKSAGLFVGQFALIPILAWGLCNGLVWGLTTKKGIRPKIITGVRAVPESIVTLFLTIFARPFIPSQHGKKIYAFPEIYRKNPGRTAAIVLSTIAITLTLNRWINIRKSSALATEFLQTSGIDPQKFQCHEKIVLGDFLQNCGKNPGAIV